MNNGLLVVLSGPSGSGKDTVLKGVLEKMDGDAFLSVSMTTRAMRRGEREGVDYFFVTEEQFQKNIENDLMLEYAKYGSNYYGTPIGPVKDVLKSGKTVFLNIEVQGGANIRRLMPEAVQIFIAPPSRDELERRLRKRGTESEECICERLRIAEEEMKRADEYDFVVVNDVLEDAVEEVLSIVKSAMKQ